MGASVANCIRWIRRRAKSGTGGFLSESELKNPHPRIAEAVPQGIHIRSDHAQILGDDGKFPNCKAGGIEKFSSRPRNPFSIHCSGLIRGNFPVRCKAAEVIDSDDIIKFKGGFESGDPPRETLCSVGFPSIKRISPALSGLAEVIGGYSRDDRRLPVGLKKEKLRSAPYICAVVSYKDRDVPDDRDPTLFCLFPKQVPLPEKKKLENLGFPVFVLMFLLS
jgi:hypothetical protein